MADGCAGEVAGCEVLSGGGRDAWPTAGRRPALRSGGTKRCGNSCQGFTGWRLTRCL